MTDSWASSLIVNIWKETCCHGALFWSPQIANILQDFPCSFWYTRESGSMSSLIKKVLLWALYSILTYWRHTFIRAFTNVRLSCHSSMCYFIIHKYLHQVKHRMLMMPDAKRLHSSTLLCGRKKNKNLKILYPSMKMCFHQSACYKTAKLFYSWLTSVLPFLLK